MNDTVTKLSSHDINVNKKKENVFHINNQDIIELPVLKKLIARVNSNCPQDLNNTIIIGVQHILETTASLFHGLIEIGFKPENMYFTGKCYSTCPSVEANIKNLGVNILPTKMHKTVGFYKKHALGIVSGMWDRVVRDLKNKTNIDRIIVLDEGGRCLETMPSFLCFKYSTAVIEQTTYGFYSSTVAGLPISLVDVAGSATKRILEPPLIAEASLSKITKIINGLDIDPSAVCGVVGNGAIGKAIVDFLLGKGHIVTVYDEDSAAFSDTKTKKFFRVENIKNLIVSSQFIFGCTGKDITKEIDILDLVKKPTVLISCSSEDKEFISLLQQINSDNNLILSPLDDIQFLSNNDATITILRGGFPVNFDGSPSSVPPNDIQLTRALLFAACVQAIICADKPSDNGITVNKFHHLQLDPNLQRFIVHHWAPLQSIQRFSKKTLDLFLSIDWLAESSNGKYASNKTLEQSFCDYSV